VDGFEIKQWKFILKGVSNFMPWSIEIASNHKFKLMQQV
jgi:hypothetical protein